MQLHMFIEGHNFNYDIQHICYRFVHVMMFKNHNCFLILYNVSEKTLNIFENKALEGAISPNRVWQFCDLLGAFELRLARLSHKHRACPQPARRSPSHRSPVKDIQNKTVWQCQSTYRINTIGSCLIFPILIQMHLSIVCRNDIRWVSE